MHPRLATLIGLTLAAVWWPVVFYWEALDVWTGMGLGAPVLAVVALAAMWPDAPTLFRPTPQELGLGVVTAVGGYVLAWVGLWLIALVFPRSQDVMRELYTGYLTLPKWQVVVLVMLVSASEELFWRGLVQQAFAMRFGWRAVPLAALAFALVHAWSGNPMLVLGAFVFGSFWGAIAWWRKSLVAPLVSHVLWDLAIMVVLPVK